MCHFGPIWGLVRFPEGPPTSHGSLLRRRPGQGGTPPPVFLHLRRRGRGDPPPSLSKPTLAGPGGPLLFFLPAHAVVWAFHTTIELLTHTRLNPSPIIIIIIINQSSIIRHQLCTIHHHHHHCHHHRQGGSSPQLGFLTSAKRRFRWCNVLPPEGGTD